MKKNVTPMTKLKDRFKVLEEILKSQNLFDNEVLLQEKISYFDDYKGEYHKGVDADFMKIWKLKNNIDKLKYSLAFSFYGIKEEEKDVLIYVSYKIVNENNQETYKKKILSFNDFKNSLISLSKNLKFIIEEVCTDSFLKPSTLVKAMETNFNFNEGKEEVLDLKQKMKKPLEQNLASNVENFNKTKEENLVKIEVFDEINTKVNNKTKTLRKKYNIDELEEQLKKAKEVMKKDLDSFIVKNDFINIKKEKEYAVLKIRKEHSTIISDFEKNIDKLNIDRKVRNDIKEELTTNYKEFFTFKI